MDLCKYKDLFGIPGTGVHAIRIPILDIALVDTLMTIILAFVISKFSNYSFISILVILLFLAIIFHSLFCVNSKLSF